MFKDTKVIIRIISIISNDKNKRIFEHKTKMFRSRTQPKKRNPIPNGECRTITEKVVYVVVY